MPTVMKKSVSTIGGIELKSLEDNLIVGGFIATTHLDSGFTDEDSGVFIRDKLDKEALDVWADELNNHVPRANKVTINHDREDPIVAGVAQDGSAKVMQLPDGEFGLYVDSIIDSSHSDFETTNHRIQSGTLDSFSIEFLANEVSFGEKTDDYVVRHLHSGCELHGYTLASRPMNEFAVMTAKEVFGMLKKEKKINKEMEDNKVTEEKIVEQKEVQVKTMSPEDEALLKEAKIARSQAEQKELIMKTLKDESFKEHLKSLNVEDKVLTKEEEEPEEEAEDKKEEKESQEAVEYKEIFTKEISLTEKFRRAGALAEKQGLVWAEGADGIGYKKSTESKPGIGFKTFGTNGNKLQYKSLGITTNQNTDTDYLLSSAELKDVFDPVIYDVLNQSTLTWSILNKEDYSMKGNNQVQFVLRNGANPTAAFYTGNSVSTSNSDLIKLMTKFKKCQAGVSVDGDMVASARGGPIGDVFAKHVEFATEDMLTVVNSALFAETGAETAAGPIGFEYITDSAGNTTLYNMTRSSVTGLAPTSASDTYINGSSARISIDNLRKAIQQAIVEGASINNLVFITHPTQERLFKGIFDAQRMHMDTSSRFGFEGRPSIDSVPIFADKDCNTDDWFLVDLESHRIAIWVPPTLEMLGKRSDSTEGFVKMYMATYNTSPNRMVQIYGNATS
jgi:phage head maturation protease